MAKILLVEDDEILQEMYRKLLSDAGYVVIQAKEGKTGLELAKTQKPDLILLDIMLPGGMNGFEVLDQLKKDPMTKDLKVIILTNLDSEEKVAGGIGATEYLIKLKTKPDQLLEKVKGKLNQV